MDDEAVKARKADLLARWPAPRRVTGDEKRITLAELRAQGVAAGVNESDAEVACYASVEAAREWHRLNAEHQGHPSLGFVHARDGSVYGVLDLRPALAAARRKAAGE